jgi:hypothetical protein
MTIRMKRMNMRSLVLLMLTIVSLFSYVYLTTAARQEVIDAHMANAENLQEQEEKKGGTIALPDIALVKKIINITKIVLPRD